MTGMVFGALVAVGLVYAMGLPVMPAVFVAFGMVGGYWLRGRDHAR